MERFAWSLPILRTSTYITTQPDSPARRDAPTGSAKSPIGSIAKVMVPYLAHRVGRASTDETLGGAVAAL